MQTAPKVDKYLDNEEKELIEAIESDYYEFGESELTAERLVFLQQAAKNTVNEPRQKISIRVPKTDLARLKAKALREGIPYQTAINSLIHRYISS